MWKHQHACEHHLQNLRAIFTAGDGTAGDFGRVGGGILMGGLRPVQTSGKYDVLQTPRFQTEDERVQDNSMTALVSENSLVR